MSELTDEQIFDLWAGVSDYRDVPAFTRAAIQAHEAQRQDDWKTAVLDELASTCMDAPLDEAPASILERVISWHLTLERARVMGQAVQEPVANGLKVVGWYAIDEAGHKAIHFKEEIVMRVVGNACKASVSALVKLEDAQTLLDAKDGEIQILTAEKENLESANKRMKDRLETAELFNAETIDQIAAVKMLGEIQRQRKDTERLDWILSFAIGDNTELADSRTMALAQQILAGLDGRAAVDAAMQAQASGSVK
jgi:hypothetical protein